MNKTKKILALVFFITAFTANNNLSSMKEDSQGEQQQGIILGASYYIFEGVCSDDVFGAVPLTSRHVTFYTFDGNVIEAREHDVSRIHPSYAKQLLDSAAGKPQPTSCMIKYWPAISVGFWTKGTPGWFICFYDKHGNQINRYRYDRTTHEITVASAQSSDHPGRNYVFDEANPSSLVNADFPLDLSLLTKTDVSDDLG